MVGKFGCVNWYEYVRHDAAATVDGSTGCGFEHQGVGKVDGVLGEEFSVFITFIDIVAIGIGSVAVGFLYAAT